jgi:formate dehydrogenase alpha subunit
VKQRRLVPTVCPYCGCGCGLYVVVEEGVVKNIEYMGEHPVCQGSLCPKGNAALEVVYHSERIRYPMKRENGSWKRISWDKAMELVTTGLKQVYDVHGADTLAFLASAKCTNEENYLLQKLARLIGTNNVDHCARLCHASTVTGLIATLGSGAMTNPIPDLVNSKCIFIIGSNLAENHPVVSRWIWDAKEQGTKVIVADPRYTPTAWMADIFLQLKPGTDIALINGIMHIIVNEKLYNQDFTSRRTTGLDKLQELVAKYDPATVEKISGVHSHLLHETARLYAKAEAAAIVYCMGITQHTCGHGNVIDCANLALLCGQVGRPGTGVLPLRGQNNVQGACDMGALSTFLPGYVNVTDENGSGRIAQLWGRERLPNKPGLTIVEMLNAAGEGKIKGMYIMGENPVISDPNSRHVEEVLSKLDFLVVQEMFLSETARLAHVVLPAASWAEKAGSVTGTERRVQWMLEAIKPIDETRVDWQIISDIANRLGFNFNYTGPEDILCEINQVVPSYGGIIPERIKEHVGGLTWPCPTPDHPGTPILHSDTFKTADGLGRFIPIEHQPPFELPDDECPLLLTTGRVVMHYNAGAMTRRSASLLKRSPELFVEINPTDAQRLGIGADEIITVSTKRGETLAKASITKKVAHGVVFMPFHFQGTNNLTVDALDEMAKIPEFKVAACKITKG